MKKSSNKTISTFLQQFIEKFENRILNDKIESHYSGIVYTPSEVADFIVRNIFKIYIEDFLETLSLKSNDLFLKEFNPKALESLLGKQPKLKRKLADRIKSLKILDPSCGSGRFLISTANTLLKIFKILDIGLNEYDSKKFIIENSLFGIEIDKTASIISKLR
ncbi:MAG: DNA methyltransferase, partial [Promethearchaeota archaeon]